MMCDKFSIVDCLQFVAADIYQHLLRDPVTTAGNEFYLHVWEVWIGYPTAVEQHWNLFPCNVENDFIHWSFPLIVFQISRSASARLIWGNDSLMSCVATFSSWS